MKINFNKTEIQNKNLMICMVFLFIIIQSIQGSRKFILHFYNKDYLCKEGNKYNHKLSGFINDRYKCYQHDECDGCKIFEIEEIDLFPLKFEENQDLEKYSVNHVYINTKTLNLEDFLYFIKKFKEDCLSDMNFRIFLFEIRILDIFKFEYVEKLSKTIRKSLLSFIYNFENINYNEDYTFKNYFSSVLVKNILTEFLKIYFFSKINLDKINNKEEIIRVITDLNVNFIEKYEDFMIFDYDLLVKIGKKAKLNREFAMFLNRMFKKIKIKKVILEKITETNQYIELSLFSLYSVKELCLFKCETFNFLFNEKTCIIFDKIEIIFLLFCKISHFTENMFKNLKYLRKIDIVCSGNIKNTATSEIYFISSDLLIEFYDEMSKICELNIFTDISNNKKYDLNILNSDSFNTSHDIPITRFDFTGLNYQVNSYYWITFTILFMSFDLFIFDYKNLRFLNIYIENVCINRLFFTNILIVQNIRKLFVVKSTIGTNFLKEILLLQKLRDINFVKCKFDFTEIENKFSKNETIKSLKIKNSVSNNHREMYKFIKNIHNLEEISFKNNENIQWFDENFVYKKNSFENLFTLILIKSHSNKFIPDIFLMKSIKMLSIGKNYKEGSLSKISRENILTNISDLRYKEFDIGPIDKLALKNFSRLKALGIYSCRFKSCLFSDIFDPEKEYFLEKLFLKKLVLKKQDILFIFKLRHLKKLHIDVLHIEDTNSIQHKMATTWFYNNLNINILTSSDSKSTLNRLEEEFSSENISIYFFYNIGEWFVT